jgi:uncharacterized membrane protein
MLLKPERLKSFSDSVIVVAVVLLVYNLATIATTDPEAFQPQLFFGTLVAYVNSFIVVFFFWVTFTSLRLYQAVRRYSGFTILNIPNTCYTYQLQT